MQIKKIENGFEIIEFFKQGKNLKVEFKVIVSYPHGISMPKGQFNDWFNIEKVEKIIDMLVMANALKSGEIII